MAVREFHLHSGKKGAALAIHVIPLSKKDEIAQILADGTIQVRLKTPQVDGEANQALEIFLAEVLGVSRSRIDVVAGKNQQDKLVSVLDMNPEGVQQKIIASVSSHKRPHD